MEIYKMENIIHYPSLKTILMIEKVLKNAETVMDREELKRRLPVKIMHQTLNLILAYLEDKGMIIDSHKGILWIYNPSQKLKKAIENGGEIYAEDLSDKDIKRRKELIIITMTIIKILQKFGVTRAGIFGSYARGDFNKDSDIDVLVEFRGKRSLLDLVDLKSALEKELNKKADVITYKSINPLLKKRILNEEIKII